MVYPGHVNPFEDKYPYFIVIRAIIMEAVGKIIAIIVSLWMRVVLDKRVQVSSYGKYIYNTR